jgi:radical SAM protein with 4Fe4S-binding SPASM domain
MGCERVVLKGGGEPLIHPNIKELIDFIGSYHAFKIGIVSNGTVENDGLLESIARYVTFIRLSIDASTSETHETIHRAENFDKIIEDLKTLIALRSEFKTKLQVGINFVIWKQNYNEILSATELFKDIGVDYIHFKMAIMENNTLPNSLIGKINYQSMKASDLEEKRFVVNTKEIEGYYLYRRNKPLQISGRSWRHCIAPHIVSIIGANGDVHPCCYLKEQPEYTFGNINEKSFKIIQESKERKQIMKRINKGDCRLFCRGRTSNMRYDYPNRIYNYMKTRNPMDEGFI